MKHLKKFNESEMISISFEEAKNWIKDNYTDANVDELFDEEVSSGDWIDKEQMEEEGYESEYDYYIDYGRGEAEDAVMSKIINELKSNFKLDFDESLIYDFLKDTYDVLS